MDDLVDTIEMYLKSVLELEEEGVTALRVRISERMEHSVPTVSETVRRMQRDGLLVVSQDHHLELTAVGRRRTLAVMRKHRLAERFLADVIGLDWEHVHEEACRWEHVMSDQVEQRLDDLLQHPTHSPYGNPIGHAVDDRLMSAGTSDVTNLVRYVTVGSSPWPARVQWIGEPLQVDPAALRLLHRHGILPGARGNFTLHGAAVLVRMSGLAEEVALPLETAGHVFVTATTDAMTSNHAGLMPELD